MRAEVAADLKRIYTYATALNAVQANTVCQDLLEDMAERRSGRGKKSTSKRKSQTADQMPA
jgi:hypothetical protein